MTYSISEIADKMGLSVHTLRFYDKEGLLPFVERSSGGIRMFQESDIEWLQVIGCMKKAGMSIKDIRQYIAKTAAAAPPIMKKQRFEIPISEKYIAASSPGIAAEASSGSSSTFTFPTLIFPS